MKLSQYAKENSISYALLRKGIIGLSKTKVSFPTRQQKIQQIRIVPRYNHCKIEVVYETQPQTYELDFGKIAGVDIGLSNLAAVTSNHGQFSPILIKIFSNITSALLSLAKTTFGNNPFLLGNAITKNFVSIPHAIFASQLQYKAELVGVHAYIVKESYTSKCFFLDNEPVQKHDTYVGKRVLGCFEAPMERKSTLISDRERMDLPISSEKYSRMLLLTRYRGGVVSPKQMNPLKAEFFSM